MGINHPEIRQSSSESKQRPLFQWDSKNRKTKIIELATALTAMEELLHPNGQQVAFTTMVSFLEEIFDVSISNPHNLKHQLLSRKKCTTPFLEQLRAAFNAEVEKMYRR